MKSSSERTQHSGMPVEAMRRTTGNYMLWCIIINKSDAAAFKEIVGDGDVKVKSG